MHSQLLLNRGRLDINVHDFLYNPNFLSTDCEQNKCVIKNVALKKKSQQSSWHLKTHSWGNYVCCASEYANDGNPATYSHTNHDNLPYWWVDLGKVYDIKWIEIINRPDLAGNFRCSLVFEAGCKFTSN